MHECMHVYVRTTYAATRTRAMPSQSQSSICVLCVVCKCRLVQHLPRLSRAPVCCRACSLSARCGYHDLHPGRTLVFRALYKYTALRVCVAVQIQI